MRPPKEAMGRFLGILFERTEASVAAYVGFLKSFLKLALWVAVAAIALFVVGSLTKASWLVGSALLAVTLLAFGGLILALPGLLVAGKALEVFPVLRSTLAEVAGALFWALTLVVYFYLVPVWSGPALIPLLPILVTVIALASAAFGVRVHPRLFVGLAWGLLLVLTASFFLPATKAALGELLGAADGRLASLVQLQRLPKRIQVRSVEDLSRLVLFGPKGEPLVWYQEERGEFELFDRGGNHPQTGRPLLAVTPDVAPKVLAYLRRTVKESRPTSPIGAAPARPSQPRARVAATPPPAALPTAAHAVPREAATPPRVRRIVGAAYSYSKRAWAGQDPMSLGGRYFPDVRLGFWAGLISSVVSLKWTGAFAFEGEQLCLSVKDLTVPASPTLPEYFLDVGIGYGVELSDAVFGDYSMSRSILVFRTFAGDNPPGLIRKCFAVIPVPEQTGQAPNFGGEWEGWYEEPIATGVVKRTFVARLQQRGNRVQGVVLDEAGQVGSKNVPPTRCEVEGLIVDGRLSLVKRYPRAIVGVSYVSESLKGNGEVGGEWFSGLNRGRWAMSWKGSFAGSVDDIRSAGVGNPPGENRRPTTTPTPPTVP